MGTVSSDITTPPQIELDTAYPGLLPTCSIDTLEFKVHSLLRQQLAASQGHTYIAWVRFSGSLIESL